MMKLDEMIGLTRREALAALDAAEIEYRDDVGANWFDFKISENFWGTMWTERAFPFRIVRIFYD